MIETFLLILLFILGIYFGSFFTLATYRLPKKENITHKHSYCPNCYHPLKISDLIPLFSYLFLRGKCQYCHQPIGIRYFLLEMLSGITFVLFGLSIRINIYEFQISQYIYFGLGILYLSSLFIIAGINKEKNIIQKNVLFFGVFLAIAYMIYSYILKGLNVYAYVIYLLMMLILLTTDTILFKKHLKYNEVLQILILTLYMLIFSGTYITIATFIFIILAIGFQNLFTKIKNRKCSKVLDKKKKKSVAFFMCCGNVIIMIITNFLVNYFMK